MRFGVECALGTAQFTKGDEQVLTFLSRAGVGHGGHL